MREDERKIEHDKKQCGFEEEKDEAGFVLHTSYGDDPMLYSPDWVYALVLFVAYAFHPWANRRWLQAGLILFLGLTIAANLNLIHLVMKVSAPLYGQ